MSTQKRAIKQIAVGQGLDPDELLIGLWYADQKKYEYLKGVGSIVKEKEYRTVLHTAQNLRNGREVPVFAQNSKKKLVIIDFDFNRVGRKDVDREALLTKHEVLRIYEELVADLSEGTDPIEPAGVKDDTLLESAVFHPTTEFEGHFKYPTAESAAAALMYSLSHNHAFYNGNKRTAIVATLTFLDRHNIFLVCNEDELFRTSLLLADHKLVPEERQYMDSEIYALAEWIETCSRPITKGERPTTLRKLRHILSSFGCEILSTGKVTRNVPRRNIFGFSYSELLTSKKVLNHAIADGEEVDKGLIKSIREDLELNDANGVDSEAFYKLDNYTTSDFINKYRGLLRRLSKF